MKEIIETLLDVGISTERIHTGILPHGESYIGYFAQKLEEKEFQGKLSVLDDELRVVGPGNDDYYFYTEYSKIY